MSEKEVKNTQEQAEKVVTKYDLKMQRRAEEKARAKKEQKVSMITGIVIVVAIACFVLSFPIRSWLTVNGTYIKVGGENISRLEFDYNYNVAMNSYLNEYGTYMSYMGVDLTGDLSTQMYAEDLSFQDFFEELAVDNITQNVALKAEAKAAGFTYDATEEYEAYIASLREAAETAGMTEREFVQQNFGSYATTSRLKNIIMESLELSAYYTSVAEAKTPSDEEATAYYEENTDTYDSVDYRIITIRADLPTEPTELADPVEESEATVSDGDAAEETYEPSEAEIEFAMTVAKASAQEALETVKEDGGLQENIKRSGLATLIRDWLFDSARKAGDTTIIEDENNYLYYVLAFEDRYLDETPTVDVRVIILEEDNGDAVLEEWKSGAATEDSFAEVADKYNNAELTTVEGGLYDALLISSLPSELAEWLGDSSRAAGDTTVISPEEEEYTYVLYYVGTDEPEWILNAKSAMLTDIMNEYLEEITADVQVEDSKNRLNYLQVYAAREAAEESEAAAGSEEASGESSAEASESSQEATTESSEASSSAAQ